MSGSIHTHSSRNYEDSVLSSGNSSDYSSEEEEDGRSEDSDESDEEQQNLGANELKETGGFEIKMGQCNLSGGIDFITKFTRVFRRIKTIDFGEAALQKD